MPDLFRQRRRRDLIGPYRHGFGLSPTMERYERWMRTLQRAGRTGVTELTRVSVLGGGVSGHVAAADPHTQYILVDGSRPFTGDQSMGTHKLTGVVDPASAQDAATKNYVDNLRVPRAYIFVPDAAPGATIEAGDQQGIIYHSGPNEETATRLYVDAETAPGASGLPITIQYGDTNDLDTVGSWTTIATFTLSSQKSGYTDSMSQATIPARRLIRMNIGTIVGTPADATITLEAKVPLVSA